MLSDSVGRIVDGGTVRSFVLGDSVELAAEPLHIHQGCGRGAPPSLVDVRLRLELDDGTVTWGVGGGHCRVWLDGDSPCVEDRDSDNGTYVFRAGDVHRVDGGKTRKLGSGDRIGIGRVQLRLDVVGERDDADSR